MSKVKHVQMVRDVATWWNSTAELIARATQLCKALSLLVIDKEHNKPRGVCLKRFQLSSKEWDLLEQLHPLLKVCNHAFSCFIGLLTKIKGVPSHNQENIPEQSSPHL